MTLRVVAPSGRSPERRYVIDLILSEWLGLEYRLEDGPPGRTTISLPGTSAGSVVLPDVLLGSAPETWLTEASMPVSPLARVRVPRVDGVGQAGELPILYGRTIDGVNAWRQSAGGIDLSVDVFGSAFFFLTRYEEIVRPTGDAHGRFPAASSIGAVEGLIARPLVDEYVDLLWAAFVALWPDLTRRATSFRLRLTHDVDQPWAAIGQPPRAVLRALAGDVVRRRDPGLAARRARAILDARTGRVDRDPYDTFDLLMTVSERHGLRSTFYFLAGNEPGDHDYRYRIGDPRVLGLLRHVHDRGHEVGLHASYDSYLSPVRIAFEFDALVQACRTAGFEQATWGVRQHYLRFQNPETWNGHEAAGFAHDSTLGYADAVGFRAGTSREYPLFDVRGARPLAL
ncbi:MAG TPA: polysaccharide deacetylase family protein, partial [Candidatus Limnocylindrales bacterium]|nr:polysaccharide deacetylase family protein [Candidatus Limnocylindrales bacterium]